MGGYFRSGEEINVGKTNEKFLVKYVSTHMFLIVILAKKDSP